jgi:Ca2+:H+ antiporter
MAAILKPLLIHPLNVLLAGIPLLVLAVQLDLGPVWIFFTSAAAIIPLARFISEATESLASRLGVALGGLLNATFGNAAELIIAGVALNAGLYEVVKASLVGSILGNALAVLGTAFLVGGIGRQSQHFNRILAGAAGAQLVLAAGAMLIPAVLAATAPVSTTVILVFSVVTALVLLASYAAGLIFTLRTHATPIAHTETPAVQIHWPMWLAMVVLVAATVVVAVLSEWLVAGVTGVTKTLGWTEMFIGVIVIALVGNAAEHASAVSMAKNQHINLSLAIALGSATQIALFVAPLLVLYGLVTGHPLDLLFNSFEVAAIVVAVGLVNLLIFDGESTWLEGAQLLAVYIILAAAFFLHP